MTNQCAVRHADGHFETNLLVAPDWLGNSPAALTTRGRVNISTKQMDCVDSAGPRLYASDVQLLDQESPVTHIILSFNGADPGTHAVVFAVSGIATGTPWPTRPVLSIIRGSDGKLMVQSSRPGKLQSCQTLSGLGASWKDEGVISTNLTDLAVPAGPACFYRVLAGQ
jgi:hypothetical protein